MVFVFVSEVNRHVMGGPEGWPMNGSGLLPASNYLSSMQHRGPGGPYGPPYPGPMHHRENMVRLCTIIIFEGSDDAFRSRDVLLQHGTRF